MTVYQNKNQQQIFLRTVQEFDRHRHQIETERSALLERVNQLADEVAYSLSYLPTIFTNPWFSKDCSRKKTRHCSALLITDCSDIYDINKRFPDEHIDFI